MAFIADTQEECISKLNAWKTGMESKGHRVTIKKTKFIVSGVDLDVLEISQVFLCSLLQGVGNNSIECMQFKLWVHKKYSDITG